MKELNVDHKYIKEILTSISFVTKHNYDIEEQISDIFAYAACCKYMQDCGQKKFSKDSYESKIIKILELKLFQMPTLAKSIKRDLFDRIEPFCILPKPKK